MFALAATTTAAPRAAIPTSSTARLTRGARPAAAAAPAAARYRQPGEGRSPPVLHIQHRRSRARGSLVRHGPAGRGADAAAPVAWRIAAAGRDKGGGVESDADEGWEAMEGKGGRGAPSDSPAEASQQETEKSASSTTPGGKDDGKPARYRGIDLKGGKLGYGETVDNALDATTNPDLFIFGAAALTIGAVLAFLFGPRPPSDYYG